MISLQTVQRHTGLIHHFKYFDIRALWRCLFIYLFSQ